jgi:hypothetical protein
METPTATSARVALGIAAIPSKRRAEKIRRAIRIRFTFPSCFAGRFLGQLLVRKKANWEPECGRNS